MKSEQESQIMLRVGLKEAPMCYCRNGSPVRFSVRLISLTFKHDSVEKSSGFPKHELSAIDYYRTNSEKLE
jgi:hypothetical protein